MRDRQSRSDERVGRDDHLVAGTDPRRDKSQRDRGGTRAHADAMGASAQDKQQEIAFFDAHAGADDYDVFTPQASAKLIDSFVKLSALSAGARVADLGCGSGTFTHLLGLRGYDCVGLDISANRGTSVLAPASGVVSFAGTSGEYGTIVILDHGHDLRSLYGHLQEIRVKPGERIERGQVIALTGNTGRTSGPHLHYEIQVHGQAVDPRQFLWE